MARATAMSGAITGATIAVTSPATLAMLPKALALSVAMMMPRLSSCLNPGRSRANSPHSSAATTIAVMTATAIVRAMTGPGRNGPVRNGPGRNVRAMIALAMIGPDGEVQGTYRKSYIPDGPGYEEKYYFRPGNDGFKVWDVFGTRIGVGVCWDQWYPECARAMALMGAELLFYPTAIGTEPYDADLDTSRMWRRAMLGHAVSNCMPVIAANRIGTEDGQRFYGHSFISDEWGDFLTEFGAGETGVLAATINLQRAATHRAGMGFFRDRRPQLYARLSEDV